MSPFGARPVPNPGPAPTHSEKVPYFPYENRNDFDLQQDMSKKLTASARRNAFRLGLRNKQDDILLSKSHLPNNLSDLFGPAFVGPDDEQFAPEPWLFEVPVFDRARPETRCGVPVFDRARPETRRGVPVFDRARPDASSC